jgi:hypothetical protein
MGSRLRSLNKDGGGKNTAECILMLYRFVERSDGWGNIATLITKGRCNVNELINQSVNELIYNPSNTTSFLLHLYPRAMNGKIHKTSTFSTVGFSSSPSSLPLLITFSSIDPKLPG